MSDPLDRLTIRGFKSIRALEDFELKNLNVFIGGNGAGKSNLIDFFRLLRNVIDGNLDKYIRDGGGVSDFLFNGRKKTPHMEFETLFGDHGYRFRIEPGPKEVAFITNEARFYKPGNSGWWDLGGSVGGVSSLVEEAKQPGMNGSNSRHVVRAISSWQIYHFHDTSSSAAMRHYEIIQDNKGLRFNGSNIAPYLLRLRTKEPMAYQEILNSVRMVIPFFDDFLLEVEDFGEKRQVNLSWRQKGSDYPMQPYHLSDGSIRFICLATAMLQPEPPSTIIVDEPELGLHPAAISILAELIHNASKRTQLIVATQSPFLIDQFMVEDVIVVNREDGASTFNRLKEEDFKVWLETYSVGELWSKNVISGGPVYE